MVFITAKIAVGLGILFLMIPLIAVNNFNYNNRCKYMNWIRIGSTKLSRFLLVIAIILLMIPDVSVFAETDEEKNKAVDTGVNLQGTRQTRDDSRLSKLAANGNVKYLRWAVHDGNLVTGGIVNTGLLSYHYVSGCPIISWPKGVRQVRYLHSAVFFVSAEVINTRGDTIHIVSDNYRRSGAENSLDYSHMYAFMPLPKYFNLDQPEATDVPEVYGLSEDVGIDGIPNTGDSGESDGRLQPEEDFNLNNKLDLSLQNTVGWFAISHRKETWPRHWPAGSYPGDTRSEGQELPDIRAGRWNGEYGAYIRADQESYYVMDDRENDEFEYYPFEDKRPFPNGRRGLGVKVEVRNYQWAARLSEDIWISIFDITNEGKDIKKCIVGMYVDPDMGGSLSNDDASFDKIQDITYAWNQNFLSVEGIPMGYFGFAFLESPGLGENGIDDDQDKMVDESQSNEIDDDQDWKRWEDTNTSGVWDTEDKNFNKILDPGEDFNGNGRLDWEPLFDDLGSDGLGPEFDEYTGPDPNGTEANGRPDNGEPNYNFTDNDESDQVGLTSWYLRDVDDTMADDERYWITEIQPGIFNIRPGYERDIAWTYGSGFVQFANNEKTHRYAIALLFGNDQADILRNKRTMQVIYDNDYNFTKPPRKPRVAAIGGNKKVYLNWDDRSEYSNDPIYGNDFEAYYIYKSTEPSFGEIKTITDGFGNPLLFKPLAIYDVKNGLKGIHPVRLGSELGPEFDIGVTYNMGTDSGLKHFFIDTTVTNGRTYYYAIVSVDRGYVPEFYPELTDRENLSTISPTECSAVIQTDPLGRAISTDVNTVIVVPTEQPAGWVQPTIGEDGITHVSGDGTGTVSVEIFNPHRIKHGHRYSIRFSDDGKLQELHPFFTGQTSSITAYSSTNGDGLALKTLNMTDDPGLFNEFIFDGILVKFKNDTTRISTASWTKGTSSLTIKDVTFELKGIVVPRDYEIRILAFGADTSVNSNQITNFQVWDITDPAKAFRVKYRWTESKTATAATKGFLQTGSRVILVNNIVDKKQLWKWDFIYPADSDLSRMTMPESGDILKVITHKAFDRNDVFEFSMNGNQIEAQKAVTDLNNIYTVPDPYVAVSALERKVINFEEGRGDRRIDFVNLPRKCTITIFTASGRLVRQLEHDSVDDYAREPWDLRTKDGLEITHGIYFWVVDAPEIGTKTGKLAVIK